MYFRRSSFVSNAEISTKVYHLVKHIWSCQICTFVVPFVVGIPRRELICANLGTLFQIDTCLDKTTYHQIMTLDQSQLVAR